MQEEDTAHAITSAEDESVPRSIQGNEVFLKKDHGKNNVVISTLTQLTANICDQVKSYLLERNLRNIRFYVNSKSFGH